VKDEKVSITGTLIIQMIVFLILVGFTMKFVWPPITAHWMSAPEGRRRPGRRRQGQVRTVRRQPACGGRAGQVAHGDGPRLADAERRAQAIIEEAKARATEEGNKIVAAARAEAEQQTVKAREALREQVAALAVKGAEQILRKEVNAGVHSELLSA
jgi:F-type H+-transporting ATPase subunit b